MADVWSGLRGLVARHAALIVGIVLLFTFCRWPPLTGWDEGFYVAQLTSAVTDRDLLLQNDLLLLDNSLAQKLRSLTTTTPDGALLNTFSVGPAVAHAFFAWPVLVGQVPAAPVLRAALAFGSLTLLLINVLAMIALAERFGFSRSVARVAAVLAIACGPLALFGTRAAVNSHLPSSLWMSLLCLSCLAWLEHARTRHALALGLTAGLLTITRWQDGAFVLVLAAVLLISVARRHAGWAQTRDLVLAAAVFVAVLAAQLMAWRVQFGQWWLVPQGESYMRWTSPALLPLLFSTYHGLIPWMPGFALGLLGLIGLVTSRSTPEQRLLAGGLLVVAAAALYLSACPVDWWAGQSFGPRRLSTLTPLVALGLGQLFTICGRAWVRRVAVAALCLWAAFALTAHLSGFDDLSVPLFGRVGSASPLTMEAYAGARWLDHGPKLPLVLRPGFTFTDTPRHPDRLVGLAAVAILALLVTLGWHAVRRSATLQRAAVALGLVWVGVTLAWTARLPPDAPGNRDWQRILSDAGACAGDGAGIAPALRDARQVACAARALQQRDEPGARRYLAALDNPARYGVSEEALRAAVVRGAVGGAALGVPRTLR